MSKNNKTIKFFISSTFKDFEQERDILHKFVFPELKEICHKAKFGFQPIDLRWGVMDEAGYDQQTMNICLNEIKRSSHEPKPNLLLLVGQRYGWVPLPYGIEAQEFEEILKKIKSLSHIYLYSLKYKFEQSKTVKVWYKGQNIDTIKEWYKLDKNAIPHTYYLKDKHKYKDDRDGWSKIENQIKAAFQKASNDPKYHTSATEQEMDEGLDAVNNEHTFAYFRTITDYEKAAIKTREDFIDSDLSKLDDLSEKLRENANIPKDNQIILNNVKWSDIKKAKKTKYKNLSLTKAPKYLRKFQDKILKIFTEAIEKEIAAFIEKESSELNIELSEQNKFLKDRAKTVIGRDTNVKEIVDFITDTKYEKEPFYLLFGKSGSGKSSLMAKAISETDDEEYKVLFRFIGTSALSTYSRVLFESLYWEIEQLLTGDDTVKKESLNLEYEEHKFKKQFKEQLQRLVDKDKKVIIFLDALDQFEDYNDLSIILDDLPENIKVVFSTLYDEKKANKEDYYRYYNRLEYLAKGTDPLKVVDSNASLKIINTWLKEKNRTLSTNQYEDIKKLITKNDFTPLHLKLIFERLKHFKVDDKIDILKETEENLIIQFFEFIQKKYHHDKLLMKRIFGFISASKDGLSEEEIIDLVSRDRYLLNKFQNKRYQKLPKLPSAIWSRFYYYIEDLFTEKLIDGEMLITPFHRVIAETIKKHYYKQDDISLHKKLASYFLTLQDKKEVWDKRYNNLHMLSETPYQLFKSKNIKRLKKILFDLEFAGSIYDNHKQESFREIMEKAHDLKGITKDEMYVWESFYREKEHLILKVDEEMWRPHQSLFQLAYEDGEDSPLYKNSKRLLGKNIVNFYWMKKINKQNHYSRMNLLKQIKHNITLSSKFKYYTFRDGNILLIDLLSNSPGYNNILLITSELNSIKKINCQNVSYILQISENNFCIKYTNGEICFYNSKGRLLKEFITEKHPTANIFILSSSLFILTCQKHFYLYENNGNILKKYLYDKKITGCLNIEKNKFITYSGRDISVWSSEDGTHLNTFKSISDIKKCYSFNDKNFIVSDGSNISIYDINGLIEGEIKHPCLKTHRDPHINTIIVFTNTVFILYDNGELIEFSFKTGFSNKHLEVGNDYKITYLLKINNYTFLAASEDNNIYTFIDSVYMTDDALEGYSDFTTLFKEPLSLSSIGHLDDIQGIKMLSNGWIIAYSMYITIWNEVGEVVYHCFFSENRIIDVVNDINDKIIFLNSSTVNLISIKYKDKFYKNESEHGEYISNVQRVQSNIITCSPNKIKIYDNNYNLKKEIISPSDYLFHYNKNLNISNIFILKNNEHVINENGINDIKIIKINFKNLSLIQLNSEKINYSINSISKLKDGSIVFTSKKEVQVLNISNGVIKNYKENISVNTTLVLSNGNVLAYYTTGLYKKKDTEKKERYLLWLNLKLNKKRIRKQNTGEILFVMEIDNKNILSFSANGEIFVWNIEGDLLYMYMHNLYIEKAIQLNNKKILGFTGKEWYIFNLRTKPKKILFNLSISKIHMRYVKELNGNLIFNSGFGDIIITDINGKELINLWLPAKEKYIYNIDNSGFNVISTTLSRYKLMYSTNILNFSKPLINYICNIDKK